MKNIILLSFSLLFLLSPTISNGQQQLVKNSKAPNIVTTDATGSKINLQSLIKKNKKVLVCFFRPVWCPICNQRTHELIKRYDELKKKGIEVIAIYPSKQETMAQYVKDAKIPFLVVADPDEKWYKKYAIERSADKIKAGVTKKGAKDVIKKGKAAYAGKEYSNKGDEKYKPIINADFIIGAKRILEVAHYGDYLGDHYSIDKL